MRSALPYSDAVVRTRWRRPPGFDGWSLTALAVALAVGLPVLVVFASLLMPRSEIWAHLAETVLWDYVADTLLLALGVAIGVLVIGVGTAWLVTM